MPLTEALKFGYADDWVNACQPHRFKTIEASLVQDMNNLQDCFNKSKTVSIVFHLDSHHVAQILKTQTGNKELPTEPYPKYLGFTLDLTLA